MIIDTHAHLNIDDELTENEILDMKDDLIILSGTNIKDNNENLILCSKYNNLVAAIGFHPMEVDKLPNNYLSIIEENITNKKVVAIGEIGIDLYWRQDNFDHQKKVFIEQIEIAKRCNKPIVIHSRNANDEVLNILNECNVGQMKIVFHCFSGDYDFAKKLLKFNIMFGVGGVLTFKNSHETKNVVEKIDLKYILLETDSPFLSPDPFRGKRNFPKNVYLVAQKIAEIKGISVEEVIDITTKNAIEQFDLKV